MRVLVLGAGGTGGYFGGRLVQAGGDVEFLVRPRRAAQLEAGGLIIKSPFGDATLKVKAITQAAGVADAILLSCKAYDLESAMDAIAPAVGENTLIVPLLNGLKHLDALDARFGAKHMLGGVALISATLGPQGEIIHLNQLQGLVMGAREAAQAEVARAVAQAFAPAKFALLSPNILQEMWEKFVFITTFAGMTTLMRAPIGAILEADDGEALLREMLEECCATAAAAGHSPSKGALARMQAMLFERGSALTASMLRDVERGGPTEHDQIIGDMQARARAAGLPTPLLRTSFAHLQAYAAGRR
ncbi:2-dehydropantoate 2-reductase [Methylovirgula sp. 4M-Z18]|uniref:2-dehydropantoate 2-reductase n=1 Tax=Methylovirgula sp. 4M-Z18 TaxID=2293567 RepID=UPI000E2FD929|nr:2-dehydropantoate 2-reductase [Methylovirgula sp. 4M-Z18]RFB79990.1 2-dehydropantoate 2-reductase [Methylovirgula sp. 4M-Z18]